MGLRIGIFGDIHANYHALDAVLEDMQHRGLDRLVCLGDITMKGPLPKECVDRVRALNCPVVLGNTDGCFHPDNHPSKFPVQTKTQHYALLDHARHEAILSPAERQWLAGLPMTHAEVVDGVRLDFFHAVPHHNYVLVLPDASNAELRQMRVTPETAISAFGHNHRAFIRQTDDLLVVNAGSVGAPYDGDPRASYAIVELAGGVTMSTLVRVPYDYDGAITAAQDAGMAGWELFAHTVRTGQFPG